MRVRRLIMTPGEVSGKPSMIDTSLNAREEVVLEHKAVTAAQVVRLGAGQVRGQRCEVWTQADWSAKASWPNTQYS